MRSLVGYNPAEWSGDLEDFYGELEYDQEVGMGDLNGNGFDEEVDGMDERYLRDLARVSDSLMVLAEKKDDVDEIVSVVLEEDPETRVESFSQSGMGMHRYDPFRSLLDYLKETVSEYVPVGSES